MMAHMTGMTSAYEIPQLRVCFADCTIMYHSFNNSAHQMILYIAVRDNNKGFSVTLKAATPDR
jgi:hypothetical protein